LCCASGFRASLWARQALCPGRGVFMM
jgi:hypothetical protein